jgi:hypothetical protein
MAYLTGNPKSKSEARRRIAAGQEVRTYEPGVGTVPEDGEVSVEGPHYPAGHTWWGTAVIKGGLVVKVK